MSKRTPISTNSSRWRELEADELARNAFVEYLIEIGFKSTGFHNIPIVIPPMAKTQWVICVSDGKLATMKSDQSQYIVRAGTGKRPKSYFAIDLHNPESFPLTTKHMLDNSEYLRGGISMNATPLNIKLNEDMNGD